MKQFRIGRIHEPWVNLDPPIRSPDFAKTLALRKEDQAKHGHNQSNRTHTCTKADTSSVRLLYGHIMLSGACLTGIC